MFVFVRCGVMKSNLSAKLFIAISFCLILMLAFTACKDKEIYAESSDFESYPDYWNDFNNNTGDIYIPNTQNSSSSNSEGSNSSNSDEQTSSEDWTANFTDDEEDDNTSSAVDTDKDGTPDDTDSDDDNDGVTDDKDSDDDGDGTPDDEENKYGNQGPLVFF